MVEHIRAKFDDKVRMRLVFRSRDDHDISDLDGGARDIEVSGLATGHLDHAPPSSQQQVVRTVTPVVWC